MSTPASKPEFSKGVVEPVGDCGMFEAAIDHLTTDNNVMTPHGPDTDASKPPQDWGGRILMYGKTAEQATALRERILVALELCRGAEIEWLSGFNSNPYRLPVDQFIERAMGHSGAVEVEREYLRIIQAQDATHRKELGRLGAELSSYQDMLQDTSLEYGQKLRALEQRLAQAVDLLGQAQVFVEQGDDDSQAWMDLSSGISNLLAIASAPAIEPSRQVTDGGRNPRYEGLFDGETEEQRALRLAPATEAAKLCMGCVEQSSRIRELEHKMDYYRAASPAADFEALPFWKPCNPGCDPEFNGQRSKWCAKICHPAREALSASASASADGEWAAFERVYASYARMTLAEVQALWDGDLYQDQGLRDAWYGWKARAALSANHSEQVRDVSAMARVLSDRQADSCNVDRDDQWKIYGQDFIDDVTAMLAAPAAPAADAGIVDMYRHLQKVTPYRFKKIQDASITDGGDVMYFHKDRFDAALLADMAAHCAAKGVV